VNVKHWINMGVSQCRSFGDFHDLIVPHCDSGGSRRLMSTATPKSMGCLPPLPEKPARHAVASSEAASETRT
jgi:hypothetical protein